MSGNHCNVNKAILSRVNPQYIPSIEGALCAFFFGIYYEKKDHLSVVIGCGRANIVYFTFHIRRRYPAK